MAYPPAAAELRALRNRASLVLVAAPDADRGDDRLAGRVFVFDAATGALRGTLERADSGPGNRLGTALAAAGVAVVDECGRLEVRGLGHAPAFERHQIGDFDVQCIEEMLRSFANFGKFNIHVNVPYGTNSHHMAEAIFKAIGQAMAMAIEIIGTDVPSTKGIL